MGSTFSSSSITLGSGWQEVVADYVVRKAGTTLSMRILDTPTSSGQTFLVDDVSIVMTAPPNLPPTAGLAVTPDNGTTPLVVSADASTSSDPEGKIASYKFDFGDGTSTVTVTAPTNKTSHIYSKAGNFTVKLTATDTGSNSVEMIWVEVAGEEPRLTLDELALVQGLVFAPWISKKGEIVRNFRADSVTVLADARRTQAA